jgi:transcription elongation GreA/GreB family factor
MQQHTPAARLQYKAILHTHCVSILQLRIDETRAAMDDAQESANSEDKSSAGDKYETGRAMSQIARDKFAAQLAELMQEMRLLQSIDVSHIYDRVTNGAVIACGSSIFFIAIGLGAIPYEDLRIAILSPRSPFATAMRDKKLGDHFEFASKHYTITDLY